MKIGSTPITDIKVGSTQITKVIRNGITYWETAESYWTQRFPSNLTILVVSATQIDLSWTNNGTLDYIGVSIERSTTDETNYVEIDTVAVGESTYSDTTCLENTVYYYRIRYYKN